MPNIFLHRLLNQHIWEEKSAQKMTRSTDDAYVGTLFTLKCEICGEITQRTVRI